MTTLQTELLTYRNRLPRLLPMHDGQYVVIKGEDAVHFASTYESALDWAYDYFGLDTFFVKKVTKDQDVAHFSRDLGPCRT